MFPPLQLGLVAFQLAVTAAGPASFVVIKPTVTPAIASVLNPLLCNLCMASFKTQCRPSHANFAEIPSLYCFGLLEALL